MQPNRTDAVYLAACECYTPLGDAAATWQALLNGTIALKPVAVPGMDGEPTLPLSLFDSLRAESPPRWLEASREMVKKLPTQRPWGQPGFPVFVSSSNFGAGQLLAYHQGGSPDLKAWGTPGSAVREIARCCGFGPDVTVISNACVSAQLAMDEARRMLLSGMASEALVLSFDFLSAFVVGGFASLKILNGPMPRPYQALDQGSIGLGEGIAAAILTKDAAPFRIISSVSHQESYHMTGNEPSGAGFSKLAERLRLQSGGASFWIKGHGTGTLEAGRLEAESMAKAFPQSPLVSWKGSLGHTLGSCGLVEMAIALEAMRRSQAPGTPGTQGPCFGDTVRLEPFSIHSYDAVAILSSAFGGAHFATLIQHA